MSLFKTKTTENYSEPRRVNNVHGGQKKPRKQKNKSEDNIIKAISSRIIRDIRNIFEQESNYYKPVSNQ